MFFLCYFFMLMNIILCIFHLMPPLEYSLSSIPSSWVWMLHKYRTHTLLSSLELYKSLQVTSLLWGCVRFVVILCFPHVQMWCNKTCVKSADIWNGAEKHEGCHPRANCSGNFFLQLAIWRRIHFPVVFRRLADFTMRNSFFPGFYLSCCPAKGKQTWIIRQR